MPENTAYDTNQSAVPGARNVEVIDDLVKLTAGGESLYFPLQEAGSLAVSLYGLALALIGTDPEDAPRQLDMLTAATTDSITQWRVTLGLDTPATTD